MKYLGLSIPAIALCLSACTPTEQSTAVGALGGAAIGAAVSSDDDRAKGIITGAAVGALAGSLIGPASQPGQCYYNDGYGNRYIADC
ncbi:YMGG-like glycine zipper-containing protein [Rhodobacter sp. Har01]|uniref:YMGG-like glycine zipper-containing protein n=1 Tax=Rhodobacter sp. Har01 TaxID=2883999 RepID=UPI001D06CC1D|nr:YMGG-like glycine zipper-containing protein [Rhodobacter sp. Har01]MCB6179692.1 YMGG-like glycine zipper-containing protein [Rhodobacter sp. Har01]